jgi:hypothetical protein
MLMTTFVMKYNYENDVNSHCVQMYPMKNSAYDYNVLIFLYFHGCRTDVQFPGMLVDWLGWVGVNLLRSVGFIAHRPRAEQTTNKTWNPRQHIACQTLPRILVQMLTYKLPFI